MLLRGITKVKPIKQILAISILRSEEYPITKKELRILLDIPSDKWIPITKITKKFHINSRQIHDLASKGLILSDGATKLFRELRRRDELLSSSQWNVYAAVYHFMTKWHNMHLISDFPADIEKVEGMMSANADAFKEFVRVYGKPPRHFYSIPNPLNVHDLPLIKREGGLYEVLLKRKTSRAFDQRTPMKLEDLSVILYYVFGCHGYSPVYQDIVGVKKTSPSGGGLHPTEVYPLIINVNGLEPGLYHYNIQNHSLELISRLAQHEAAELANEFTAGQSYPRRAQALFIMASRFYRNYWKYRLHEKAYAVLLMDAAHLSQTFYLVCTELGLGAFVTGAINHINIEEKLGLDGFNQGAILACGCGKPAEKSYGWEPEFHPYIPRETKL